jgi:hypothetical protein
MGEGAGSTLDEDMSPALSPHHLPTHQRLRGVVMKFWKNNRLDAEFDLPIEQLAVLFAQSKWAGVPWLIDRRMCAFLTDSDGPVSAVWDDQTSYNALVDLVLAAERRQTRTVLEAGQS